MGEAEETRERGSGEEEGIVEQGSVKSSFVQNSAKSSREAQGISEEDQREMLKLNSVWHAR